MSNRTARPLIFSIDDRLSEEHFTRLDLSSQRLKRIEHISDSVGWDIVLLDRNEISKLEHLDRFTRLIQLSASHNRLTNIHALPRLRSLQKLDLSHNLLDSIDCLKTLHNLVFLNISHNNIGSIAALNDCHALQSVDASENCIQQVEDLSRLTSLKYLNLHKNFLDTLILVSRLWPKSLHTLIISDNEIQDLTEIAHLSSLIGLNTFYIVDNPCLSVVDERHGCYQPFDYRPYVLNWCLSIHNLDGVFITRKESLKAEWLLNQGKGRSFGHGEHAELVQYLTQVCGTNANEKKDDLSLSRILSKQDLHTQQRHHEHAGEQRMRALDIVRNASDTFSHSTQQNLHRSTMISESEFIGLDTPSSTSAEEDELMSSTRQQQVRTPSPNCLRSLNADDPLTERSSTSRYTKYDDRPVKPLDQSMLEATLSQYPIDHVFNENTNHSRTQANHANPPPDRSGSTQLVYNANHYSPKETASESTASSMLTAATNGTLVKRSHNQLRRRRRHTANVNIPESTDQLPEHVKSRLTVDNKNNTQGRPAVIDTSNSKRIQSAENNEKLHCRSVPVNTTLSTRSTTMNETAELERLTTSVETMRSSILQAYLDLHERFTKTNELQTSALSALWKKCETQSSTHQRETEKIIQENRLLNQRIRELEARLNTSESDTAAQTGPKHNTELHPPLRAHISKRDAKSFFLHWIPNPLNTSHHVLGYRIYVDDILKGAMDAGQFEAIIDYIRDEGEYKIKIRTYNEDGESADSNTVIARFRRQHSTAPTPELAMSRRRTQSEQLGEDASQKQSAENVAMPSRVRSKTPLIMNRRRTDSEPMSSMIPEKETTQSEHYSSSERINQHAATKDYAVSGKPPISPVSSPSRAEKKSPNRVHSDVSTKRSPVRAGIMSRLTKSFHQLKVHRNVMTVPSIERSNSPTESIHASKTEEHSARRAIMFEPELGSDDHGRASAQNAPLRSSFDLQDAMNVDHFGTRSDTFSTSSPSAYSKRNTTTSSLDQ